MNLICIGLVLVALAEGLTDEQHKKIHEYRTECVATTQVEPTLIERADKGDFADDPKLKCFTKCFYEKAGFIDGNGELLMDVIRTRIPKDTHYEKSLAIIEECKKEKGNNDCENVFLVHKCYVEKIRKLAD